MPMIYAFCIFTPTFCIGCPHCNSGAALCQVRRAPKSKKAICFGRAGKPQAFRTERRSFRFAASLCNAERPTSSRRRSLRPALPGGLSSGEGEVCVSACRNRLFQKNKSENFKKDLQKERRCGNIHKSAEVVGRKDVCPYPNGRNARLSSGIRRTAAPIPDSGTRVHIRKRIEVVITGLTRNQVVLTGSWVRIPPLPPLETA